ncbi:MAG: family transporter [Gemmatimonadetes bacterium]|nr:family transporter [Gemmatimonadota bacterium]
MIHPSASAAVEPEPFNWRAYHGVVVLLILGLFLASVRSVLNPFLLYLLLVFVVSPYSGTRFHLLVVSSTGALTLLWLLSTTGFLLAPFLLAIVLAYVLHPVVCAVERPWMPRRFRRETPRRIPRTAAVALLTLPLLIGIALVVLLGVPALGEQLAAFIQGIPELIRRFVAWAQAAQAQLATRSLPFVSRQTLAERLQAVQPDAVVAWLQARQSEMAQRVWAAFLGLGRGIGSVLSVLSYVFLTPILTFYLLRDWEALTARLAEMVPHAHRDRVLGFARDYDRLLAGYLRGQLTESAIVGLLTWIFLWIWGFPYAFLVGVVAGTFNVMPYMGLLVSLIPAVAISLFSGEVVYSLVKVAVTFTAVQAIDGTFVAPKVVGDAVGLHPVWVMLALAVAGFFFGFVGLLIAIPVAVGIKLVLESALSRYRESSLFRGERGLVTLD